MQEPTVCILLAARNGEAFIRQQIESVLSQDHPELQLILSDDGSEDETAEILARYGASFPERVTCYQSGRCFGSAQKHFMHLLTVFNDAPYIMFCDQDDVWHRDKVRKTLETIKRIEGDGRVPALVHTDLRVVDRQLSPIADSFCAYSAINGNRLKLNRLLVQNVVTGCTVMINRPLAELACAAVPEYGLIMHDWWLALLASACGRAGFLNEATVDYRQHEGNSVGAKKVYSAAYLRERLTSQRKMRDALTDTAVQAEAFLHCYEAYLTPKQAQLLRAFAATKELGTIRRDAVYLRFGLLKDGLLRLIPQLLGM